MASPLLETKLYIPKPRGGLVARPKLSERLGRGAESKLTLISAPAGFGKTKGGTDPASVGKAIEAVAEELRSSGRGYYS